MKTKAELKKMVCAAIDARRDDVLAFAESVAAEPELGFKEEKTSAKFAALLRELGREPRTKIALTGVVDEYRGAKSELRVAVMGELDAILVCSKDASIARQRETDSFSQGVHRVRREHT